MLYKPYYWIKDSVIIFFYVNNIIIAFKKGSCQKAEALIALIK